MTYPDINYRKAIITMNEILKLSAKELETLDKMIAELESEIQKAPAGTLRICKRNGNLYFYQRFPGSREKVAYIPKDNIALARELAQKDYNLRLLKNLTAQRGSIKKLTGCYPADSPESIYEKLSPERQLLVKPLILTDAQYTSFWLSEEYSGLAFKADDHSNFITENGERVRSKSEIIIANFLLHSGIPYKYECPLSISGQVIYPDFTLLDAARRRTVYLEHFGMLDTPQYANSFVRKMNFYQMNGILQGDRLFATYESSEQSLDTRVLARLFENFSKPVWPKEKPLQ